MHLRNLFILIALVSVLSIGTMLHTVHAERIGIAVDEGKIAFDVDTDEMQKFVIKVTNISDAEQKVYVDAMDYDIGDDNRITFLSDTDERNGIKEWLVPSETEFVLPPNMGKEVTFTVTVPQSATVGSHRGAAIFRAVPNNDADVKIHGQIGVHVLINVKGDTHASGTLNHFDVPLIVMSDVEYAAEFENTGNIHYVPYGEVIVRNVLTARHVTYDLNDGDHFVFPGKKFTFMQSHTIPSLAGLYRVHVRFIDGEGVVYTKSDFMMGYLFPVCCIMIAAFFWFFVRWIRRYGAAIQARRQGKK